MQCPVVVRGGGGWVWQVKGTVSSMTGVDTRCLYLHPIESPSTSLAANSMSVGELNWFNRRGELRLRMTAPEAVDGCAPGEGHLAALAGSHEVLHAHPQ